MERLLSARLKGEEEEKLEVSLRPRYLSEYIGQEEVKESLAIFIQAARARKEPLDHVLLYGPPGLGKTTLAGVIANELGVQMRISSGPAIERPGDLAAILTNLQPGDVLFLDEIHRLSRAVEEILYPAMEDYCLDIILGKGPAARSLRLKLPPFTLIGATTRAGLVSSPLRNRFGVTLRLNFYRQEELARIIKRSAQVLGIEIDQEGAEEIARRARGTPRVANRLLKRVRDYAEVRGEGRIDLAVARAALEMLQVDEKGLDAADRQMLLTLIDKFGGGPVGLETLAASLNEEPETVEDVLEPYLMQIGYLKRTPRGRVATPLAFAHLGRPVVVQEVLDL